MMHENDNEQSWIDKLRHTYRLVIMNNETFEEMGSYRLSLLNVYVVAATILVVVILLVGTLIAFTPLRQYIPGYGDIRQSEEVQNLRRQLEEMEAELRIQREYSDNFRRILVGEVETTEDIADTFSQKEFRDTVSEVTRAKVDTQLRQEVEMAAVGDAIQESRTTNLYPRETPLEQMYFVPPLTGEISAQFMPDKKHLGVDVLAPKNTPVKAIMDGFVFLSDWTLETGNTIGIQHTNNIITFYKHNSALLKKAGSYVKAGEAVAIIGNTGTQSDGPHLHFELWYRGKAVNPLDYVNF